MDLKEQERIKKLLERLDKKYPIITHTNASRLFTTIRRMRIEKELNLPINIRSGCVISTKIDKSANSMNEQEWESFFNNLSKQLNKDYPELYQKIFINNDMGVNELADLLGIPWGKLEGTAIQIIGASHLQKQIENKGISKKTKPASQLVSNIMGIGLSILFYGVVLIGLI